MRTTILFFLVCVIVCVAATPVTELQGPFDPIEDINDSHIQELGAWAVADYNKRAGVGLRFNRVVSGEFQVVIGVRYRFIIDASEPHGAFVADLGEPDETGTRILFSFRPVT